MQIGDLARRSGLAGLAFTDHDILPDPTAAVAVQAHFGVMVLAGVELSTVWQGRSFHLLGYGFQATDRLRALSADLVAARRVRFRALALALRDKRVKLDAAEIERVATTTSPGRDHLARILLRDGVVRRRRDAFQHYLSPLDGVVTFERPTLAEAVEILHAAGGAAVLAHPPTGMTVDDWRGLAVVGLDGVEVEFPSATKTHRRFLADRAVEYGWTPSAGSDFHSTERGDALGRCTIDDATYERLAAKFTVVDPREMI
ncbi:MAG: PHP domain-containing protein [Planctomycetia bacterium]